MSLNFSNGWDKYPFENQPFISAKLQLYNQKNEKDALLYIEKALESNPKSNSSWNFKGGLLAKQGKFEESMKCFDKSLKINSNDPISWTKKGLALLNVNYKSPEILQCFDKALELDPEYVEAWNLKSYHLLNWGRNTREGLLCGLKAVSLGSSINDFLIGFGFDITKGEKAWSEIGARHFLLGDWKLSIPCFDEALKINPQYSEAWCNKGIALANLGSDQEAIDCFDKAIEFNHDYSEAWFNKGKVILKLNKVNDAKECIKTAVGYNHKEALTLLQKIECYELTKQGMKEFETSKFEKALEIFDKALKFDANNAETWYLKGETLAKLNRIFEMQDCFEEAAKLGHEEAKKFIIGVFTNLGISYATGGFIRNEDRALDYFNRLLQIDPKNLNGLSHKSIIHFERKQFEDALVCFDKILDIQPDNYNVWFNKGVALEKVNKKVEALECYEQALQFKPDFAMALGNKGCIQYNFGKREEGIMSLKRAAELGNATASNNLVEIAQHSDTHFTKDPDTFSLSVRSSKS